MVLFLAEKLFAQSCFYAMPFLIKDFAINIFKVKDSDFHANKKFIAFKNTKILKRWKIIAEIWFMNLYSGRQQLP